ncbi:MAG: YicC family protein [Acidimicrobiia bacterium]|nr:YicC family protein [Acidimicrobiia bacterium]
MIKSMTGFASLTHDSEEATVGVTVRAVNHRFLDLQLRVPPAWGELEPAVRALVQRRLTRGRVEVAVTIQPKAPTALTVELNEAFVAALHAALDRARERGIIAGALAPGDLLRLPQAIAVRDQQVVPDPASVERIGAALDAAVSDALGALDAMRSAEGAHLRRDLDVRRGLLAELITRLQEGADAGRAGLEARLRARVAELRQQPAADEALVAQEIVRVAQRSDVSEEVARFRGHLEHWDALANSEEPCGRKLDFLLQEMNREINTLGAKADGLGIPELVIAAKAELERLREQVQNVE